MVQQGRLIHGKGKEGNICQDIDYYLFFLKALCLSRHMAFIFLLFCLFFRFRACIAIAVLFILSATGIFVRALRSLVVERHPIRVWRFSSSHQLFFS